MSEGTTEVNLGIGSLGTLLGVLFVGLKLGNVINWSWLWVLAPFWIPISIALVLFALAFIVKVFLR